MCGILLPGTNLKTKSYCKRIKFYLLSFVKHVVIYLNPSQTGFSKDGNLFSNETVFLKEKTAIPLSTILLHKPFSLCSTNFVVLD